jgi:hypothetical protein
VDRRCGPDPRVHGAPVTQRRRVTRSGPSVSRSAAKDSRARETTAHGRLAAVPGGGFAGNSKSSPGTWFSMGYAPTQSLSDGELNHRL